MHHRFRSAARRCVAKDRRFDVYVRGVSLYRCDIYMSKMSARLAFSLLKETYVKWSDHEAPRLGASVAFYSILSFAPLLVLVTALIALVFGHESAQNALINEARELIGDRGADTVQILLRNAQKPASGLFASLVAFATVLFGASGVFTELQNALNVMWDVEGQSASGFVGMVKQRLFSFGMVLSVGFLLLILLVISAGLAYMGRSFAQLAPLPPFILQVINFVVSFTVIAGLFALMFKYVPAAKISWRDVRVGAVGTALLFTIGKHLLGLYLGKASIDSAYGAAGSLVAIVVWIYYSAQIFFFGAQFIRVHTEASARKSEATAEREAVKPPEPAMKLQPVVEAREALMRMAAGVGSPSVNILLPAPAGQVPARAVIVLSDATTADAPVMGLRETPDVVVTAIAAKTASRTTAPRLLLAAAVGFVLGRISGPPGTNKEKSKHAGSK